MSRSIDLGRTVFGPHLDPFHIDHIRDAGRNGGHITPAAFFEFHARATKYGPEEAKRSYALEAHTASSLVRLIHDHGWTDDVDLVHGGHISLLFSDKQVEKAWRDREAAADAGWSLDDVVVLSKEEVEAVIVWRFVVDQSLISSRSPSMADVWCALFGSEIPGIQCLATQARHETLSKGQDAYGSAF